MKIGLGIRLAALGLAMTAVLVAMIAMKQYTLNAGTLVHLETKPIDPRSLFRGDYVRLNYAISEIDLLTVQANGAFERNDTAYVALAPGEPYWTVQSVGRERPSATAGAVILKGRVDYLFQSDGNEHVEPYRTLVLRYGLENYFVPEGEGRALEQPAEGDTLSVMVAVDRFGNAGVTQILINGEPRYSETLF